jgi:hypothetical protein
MRVWVDLRTGVDLFAAGDLVVNVGWRGRWDHVSEAVNPDAQDDYLSMTDSGARSNAYRHLDDVERTS